MVCADLHSRGRHSCRNCRSYWRPGANLIKNFKVQGKPADYSNTDFELLRRIEITPDS